MKNLLSHRLVCSIALILTGRTCIETQKSVLKQALQEYTQATPTDSPSNQKNYDQECQKCAIKEAQGIPDRTVETPQPILNDTDQITDIDQTEVSCTVATVATNKYTAHGIPTNISNPNNSPRPLPGHTAQIGNLSNCSVSQQITRST